MQTKIGPYKHIHSLTMPAPETSTSVSPTVADFEVLSNAVNLVDNFGDLNANGGYSFDVGGAYSVEISPSCDHLEVTRDKNPILTAEKIDSDWNITSSEGITNQDAHAFSTTSFLLQEHANTTTMEAIAAPGGQPNETEDNVAPTKSLGFELD